MRKENPNVYPSMRNPGDTRPPEGVVFLPKPETVIESKRINFLIGTLLNRLGLTDRRYVSLYPNGRGASIGDEKLAIKETTYS